MRNRSLLIVLSLFVGLAGCKKYEDGPAVSMRTKKTRLANAWIIDAVYEDGVDKTSDYQALYAYYTLNIGKDHAYTLEYRLHSASEYSESGSWEFSDDKTHVFFTRTNAPAPSDWTILRLKEKEFRAQYTDYSFNPARVVEMHFVSRSR